MAIKNVYVFQNDMCMVFDEKGEQMAELQGKWEEKKSEIYRCAAEQKEEIEWNGTTERCLWIPKS